MKENEEGETVVHSHPAKKNEDPGSLSQQQVEGGTADEVMEVSEMSPVSVEGQVNHEKEIENEEEVDEDLTSDEDDVEAEAGDDVEDPGDDDARDDDPGDSGTGIGIPEDVPAEPGLLSRFSNTFQLMTIIRILLNLKQYLMILSIPLKMN